MISTNEQYHSLINLIRATKNCDLSSRTLLVCAFVYKLGSISENNLINILNGCNISLNKVVPHTILHFFYYNKVFSIKNNNLGLVTSLNKIQAKPYYTADNINFAQKEMERIWRAKI